MIISHRGNINGPDTFWENHPTRVEETLKSYNVEIDVWIKEGKLYLGHDKPQYRIDSDFLKQPGLWCHAKDIVALTFMVHHDIHCFWHNTDDYTLTSKGYIWAYPEKLLLKRGIKVINGQPRKDISYKYYEGICTDYPNLMKEITND